MKTAFLPLMLAASVLAAFDAPVMLAQDNSSILLFSPLNVRPSQSNASYPTPLTFNSTTINLTCPSVPTALLASTATSNANGPGNIVVDNTLSVTNLTTHSSPVNVCTGTSDSTPDGPVPSCFTTTYQSQVSNSNQVGVNPDTLSSIWGVPPIDIKSFLVPGPQQVKIDLVDTGGSVTNSTLYLTTNCSSTGVNGPAIISGNTIQPTPTPSQLNQSFNFNPTTDQLVGFQYDLRAANNANTLTIDSAGVNPQVTDKGLEPLTDYPVLVKNTSFATSSCLIHDGETLNDHHVCKLYTLQCTTGTGSSATGAQCPVSSVSNETLKDVFDGPSFQLPDFTSAGTTFHQGLGFLMANEDWTGGPCQFDPASNLQSVLCPQNLLVSFTGPGTFEGTGRTTHPNSTFISIAQVPEDLTTVVPTDAAGTPVPVTPGHWTKNRNPYVRLSSQPPPSLLPGSGLAGAADFVAAPITSITYGVSAGTTAPPADSVATTDTVLANSAACPAPTSPTDPAATVFTPPNQQLSNLADGFNVVHYYAQDCAGTQELLFTKDDGGVWSTSFYTYAINLDQDAPTFPLGVTLSPGGPYVQGQNVTATYTCEDALSGIVSCGTNNLGTTGVPSAGPYQETFVAGAPGLHTFNVQATDEAGNQMTTAVDYVVATTSPVSFKVVPNQIVYPLSPIFTVGVPPLARIDPTGSFTIYDGQTPLGTYPLSPRNHGFIQGILRSPLSAGPHSLQASYSGDSKYPSGLSPVVPFTEKPGPVQLLLKCTNTPIKPGKTISCTVFADEIILPVTGTVAYTVTGGMTGSAILSRSGTASIAYTPARAGQYTLTVSYAAQGNYEAARPISATFTVR